LTKIDEVYERDCPCCGSAWMRGFYKENFFYDICEICGYEVKWVKDIISKGKKIRKKKLGKK